jgi:CheY-like chemotaxis protein
MKKAVAHKPDIFVLDVMMQDSTEGFHTAYAFRENENLRYTPILDADFGE